MISEGTEFGNLSEGFLGEALNQRRVFKPQGGAIVGASELTGEEEELQAPLRERAVLQGGGETSTWESRYQVIGEANQFPVQGMGLEGGGGNLAQGEGFAPFVDAELDGGAAIIEMPYPRGVNSRLAAQAR